MEPPLSSHQNNKFASKLGFVMAAAGSAIGIGNIWSFPTLAASHGGGAFLFTYLIFTIILGYPMLLAELAIGRYGKKDPASSLLTLARSPISKFFAFATGLSSILVAFFILSFYAIVAGWFISYGLEPITTSLGFHKASHWLTSFEDPVLRDVVFTFIFCGLSFYVVQKGVEEGIEKWSKKLMPLLFALLFGLSLYLMFLPGAAEGLRHYLVPDFEKALSREVISTALGQSFFSLSLGAGVMMVYGSYLDSKESIPKLGALVAILDTLVAVLAGLLIIPAIFVAKERGIDIFNEQGMLVDADRLVFSTLPELFKTLGPFSLFIAPLFYLLMTVAALTSSISMLEAPVSFLEHRTKLNRSQSLTTVSLSAFLMSVLIIFNFDFLFTFVVKASTQYAQPLVSLGITLFVAYLWRKNSLLKEMASHSEEFAHSLFWKLWYPYLKFVCPLLLFIVIWQSF